MLKTLKIAVTLLLLAGGAYAAFGEVVSSFAHPRGTGTAGLCWDGAYLWFAGQPSSVFLRTNTTGSIVGSFNIGGTYNFIKGLTFDGEYLWYSEAHPTQSIWYYRLTTTGSLVDYFGAGPCGPGLTWESPYLWCGPAKFTTAGSFVASFKAPFTLATDLGWYGHKLWVGGPGNRMYNVTTNGSVAASFPVPAGGEAAGTTFDGQYLWLINATNNWVYQVDIDVVGMNPGSFGKIKGLYR